MNVIGYEPRVFSVSDASSRSSARVSGIDDDVLEDRAEAARRLVDLRLGLARELDHLRVAATLEVEHAGIAPAVLVVADQATVRIARERRLAGAGQSEEERGVAVLADVRRAVHREHALQRQGVVEDGEDRFLDFAGVVRAADEHDLLAEVDEDEDLGARPVLGRVALEVRRIDHRELGPMRRALRRIVLRQEHVAREQIVPGELVDDANRQLVLAVGAGPGVEDVEFLVLQIRHHVLVERVELGFVHGPVDVAPVHVPFARRLAHDELVVRRPSGVLAGLADEWALSGQNALTAAKSLLVQGGRVQVPVDASRTKNAKSFETVRPLNLYRHAVRLPPLPAVRSLIAAAISRGAIVTKTPIVLVRSGSVNSTSQVPGSRFQIPRSAFRTWNLERGTWNGEARGSEV